LKFNLFILALGYSPRFYLLSFFMMGEEVCRAQKPQAITCKFRFPRFIFDDED